MGTCQARDSGRRSGLGSREDRDLLPNRLKVCGSVVSCFSGVRGRSPAANDFGAFYDFVPIERHWWIPGSSHFCVSAVKSHVITSAAAGFQQAVRCL
jgi:hypothetical protein